MKTSFKKIISSVALISLACFTFSFIGSTAVLAATNPATVNLGGAASFGVLSKTAISDTVPTGTSITGDIGVSPAAATLITGIACSEVVGTIHVVSAGGATVGCQTVDPLVLTPIIGSMEAAYTDAFGRAPGDMVNIATALDGLTLTHGVYNAANLLLNSGQNLTLDCSGDASGVFIFHTAGSLTVGSSAHVNLIGSCSVDNIFWAVAGVTNIGGGVGTESTFRGTVLGGPSTSEISVVTGSTVYGRLLGEKTIALDQNIISIADVVLDTTPPVITRLGSTPVTLEFGSTYTDAGATALDDVDGVITSSIATVNPVNTALLGVYTVTYNVSDAAGNPAVQVTRTVNVVDTTLPVITRLGLATTSIVVGAVYTDAGATALDNVDGNITAGIITVNPVNTALIGTYTVTYNITDSSGNVAVQKTRTVRVIAAADNVPPVITVVGSSPVSLTVGTVYTDDGATALDDIDGDITDNIVTVDPVNKDVVGTYTVTYNVTDSSGNPAVQKTRTVNVIAKVTSSGSSGGGTHYGCKDVNATNYEYFAASKPSLCVYTSVAAPVVTAPTTATYTYVAPLFPNSGLAPESSGVFSKLVSFISWLF